VHPAYKEFIKLIESEDKEKCVEFVLSKLDKHELDVLTLYREILTPSLNTMDCEDEELNVCIWKEHVRSSIIRTIIECCYPYLIRERDTKYKVRPGDKVVVVCPEEELHEIGPRMVADFFTILGFDVLFVGANTPRDNILAAIQYDKPKYIAFSVTNFYNLVAAKKTIRKIRKLRDSKGQKYKIIVGGNAFKNNPRIYQEMGADHQLQTFEDLRRLVGGA
jgi:methanogenic corrinoid protein MtbC1